MDLKDKIVFGGLYGVLSGAWERKGIPNDQAYWFAVPVPDDDGNIWMQDTYQLEPWSGVHNNKTDNAIEGITNTYIPGYNGYILKKARANYYFHNQRKISTESDLEYFKFICYLGDYKYISKEDAKDYEEKDLVRNVKLYNEHGYSMRYGPIGVTIVRKDAAKSKKKIFEHALEDAYESISYPRSVSLYKMNCLDDAYSKIENPSDEIKNDYEKIKKLNTILSQMEKEIVAYK